MGHVLHQTIIVANERIPYFRKVFICDYFGKITWNYHRTGIIMLFYSESMINGKCPYLKEWTGKKLGCQLLLYG